MTPQDALNEWFDTFIAETGPSNHELILVREIQKALVADLENII